MLTQFPHKSISKFQRCKQKNKFPWELFQFSSVETSTKIALDIVAQSFYNFPFQAELRLKFKVRKSWIFCWKWNWPDFQWHPLLNKNCTLKRSDLAPTNVDLIGYFNFILSKTDETEKSFKAKVSARKIFLLFTCQPLSCSLKENKNKN